MPGSRQNLQRHLVLFVNKLKVFFITASQIHSLGFIVLLVAATSEFQSVIVFGLMSKISWNWQLYVKIFSLTLTWVLFCNCAMWIFLYLTLLWIRKHVFLLADNSETAAIISQLKLLLIQFMRTAIQGCTLSTVTLS